ncbi:MAG: tetratricopeptide (TPR) repeat protein [Gammaproteobacteria bacterium]
MADYFNKMFVYVVVLLILLHNKQQILGVCMGLFGKIFGSRVANKTSGELLKEATQLKKSGDWDGAIEALRKAYKKAKSEGISYGADAYLRLPKYLYEAGRAGEAWSEYNRALAEGLDGQAPSKEMASVEHSQVYGSMAGQLKKEKKFYDAAMYQAGSALSWEKGMVEQQRESELDFDLLQKTIKQTLKKYDANEAHEQFIDLVKEATSNPMSNSIAGLITKLRDIKKR